jgi:hypothetical protein
VHGRGKKSSADNISVRYRKGRGPFERSGHKWEDNIKMDVKERVSGLRTQHFVS